MQLCKAKGVIGKEWVEGYFCYGPFSFRPCIQNVETYELSSIDLNTLCRDSGLTDINGIKMWENDIVKGLFYFGMPVEGVVAFRDGAFGLVWSRDNVQHFNPFVSMCNIAYEVVGNTIDNPELLKEQATEEISLDR